MEMLALAGLLSILLMLAIPVVNRARSASLASQCTQNLRNIVLAAQSYAFERNGSLPDLGSWRMDGPPYIRWSLFPYLYKDAPVHSVNIRESVFACPVVQNNGNFRTTAPDNHLQGTYAINIYMHGSNFGDGGIGNYSEWKTLNPVAWTLPNIPRPSATPFFMDGAVMSDFAVRYSTFQAPERTALDPGHEPNRRWTTPFGHSGKRINVAFADGHITPMDRTEVNAMDWTGRK